MYTIVKSKDKIYYAIKKKLEEHGIDDDIPLDRPFSLTANGKIRLEEYSKYMTPEHFLSYIPIKLSALKKPIYGESEQDAEDIVLITAKKKDKPLNKEYYEEI